MHLAEVLQVEPQILHNCLGLLVFVVDQVVKVVRCHLLCVMSCELAQEGAPLDFHLFICVAVRGVKRYAK